MRRRRFSAPPVPKTGKEGCGQGSCALNVHTEKSGRADTSVRLFLGWFTDKGIGHASKPDNHLAFAAVGPRVIGNGSEWNLLGPRLM